MLTILLNFALSKINQQQTEEISYSKFVSLLQEDKVESVRREAKRYLY